MKRRIIWLIASLILMLCLIVALPYFLKSKKYSGLHFSEENHTFEIFLEGDHIFCDKNPAYRVEGCRITIYHAGKYKFTGNLENGQIIVNAGKQDKVTLQLNDVKIHCEDSAPIFVKSADKVKIKLKDDTENYLSDGEAYAEVPAGEIKPKACIYSRDDLVIKGKKGMLTVDAHAGNGIHSSDDLKIKSGTIHVNAKKAALKGSDSVVIEGGTLDLSAEKDGIYSKQKVAIYEGDVRIQAMQYGIYGRKQILIKDTSHVTIEKAKSAVAGLGDKIIEKIEVR